jgi:DNA-binding winged helix-turn-helix (wHTH) protein/tetratricopeptide (TPR) repeat protein
MAEQVIDRDHQIDLAHTPSFQLAENLVCPTTRQIMRGGASETLEPRVMQVLVALAQAEGTVVTSDELIQRCWGGRIVGENAIHRVISRVRHVAATIGGGSFRIETIAKVGYRLIVEGASDESPPPPSAGPRRARARPWMAAAAAVALLAAGALGLWTIRPRPPTPPTVAILAADGQGAVAALASGLAVDLSGSVGGRPGGFMLVGAPPGGGPTPASDYVVRVSEGAEGAVRRTDLGLLATSGDRMLWSASIERPGGEAAARRGEVAARLGPVLRCLAFGDTAGPGRLDAATLQLYLAWCDRGAERFDEDGLTLLRQITARAPGFSRGWASLAMGEALDLGAESSAEERRTAAGHLRRARAGDAALPETFIAEANMLTDPGRWRDRLRLYEQGIAAAPDFAPLYFYQAFELSRVGRMQDSVRAARRAVALDPSSPATREALVSGLAYSGQFRAAFRELEAAEQLWPGARDMRALRYRMELRYGDPRRALSYHDQPDLFDMRNPPTDQVWEAFLRARIDPRPGTIDAAVAAFMVGFRRDPSRAPGLIQTLGQFGRVDEAYRLLAEPAAARTMRHASEVLFRAHMHPLLADRRFIAFAARIGLLRYWRETGIWPDFCLDPQLPYDCRAEAARLLRPNRG